MPQSPLALQFVIVGNPENRRVTLFQDALARQGLAPARIVRWLDVATRGSGEDVLAAIPREPAIVRIDSFGEDFDVERALLVRGHDDAAAAGAWSVPPKDAEATTFDLGRIFAPRQQHFGFLRALADLERDLRARPELRVLSAPSSIARLFDKSACATAFAAAGIPIATPLPVVRDPAALRDAMEARDVREVYVKLTCGSSASCLALYAYDPRRKREASLFTSMEIDGRSLYNSLRPRRYLDRGAIERLLGFLLREGSHVETALPKARVRGRWFDTRMLVVGGGPKPEVAFTIVRTSAHPITNLHLGGTRGTLEELAHAVGEEAIARAHAVCADVHAIHEAFQIGVDVMFTPEGAPFVLEANAFGDLFPNLTRDGLPVYDWQIQRLLGAATEVR